MFRDARSVPAETEVEVDVCIIGAGAAGITVARQFIGHSRTRVALLEGGGMDATRETAMLNEGESVGLPYFPLAAARLRYFGGTTNHWGGYCRPFDEEDFQVKSWIPYSGWPISLAELAPYYETAGAVCGLLSSEWSPEYWESASRFAPIPMASDRFESRLAQIVPQPSRSFGSTYREEIEAAPNVTTYLYANVTRIEADAGGGNVARAHVATLSGNRFSVAAKLFVLACGGIENPRLLLASTQQQEEGLGNANGLVGRFFLEHPRFVAGIMVPADPRIATRFYQAHPVGVHRIQGYLGLAAREQAVEGLSDVQLRVRPLFDDVVAGAMDSEEVRSAQAFVRSVRRRESISDFGRHLGNVTGDLMSWQAAAIQGTPIPVPYPELVSGLARSTTTERHAVMPGMLGRIPAAAYERLSGRSPVEGLALIPRLDPVPNPDSRITLASARDALGMPLARLDWRLSPLDMFSVRRTLEILGAEVGRAGLGRVQILVDEDTGWPEEMTGGWHHMGTTRMSDDPNRGVVDANCRVHGLSNLFIAGSSVFPTGGAGTPTLTLVAFSLRLAEHLKGRLR